MCRAKGHNEFFFKFHWIVRRVANQLAACEIQFAAAGVDAEAADVTGAAIDAAGSSNVFSYETAAPGNNVSSTMSMNEKKRLRNINKYLDTFKKLHI